MALEHGDSTQRGNETSLGCFETKGFFCGPHYYRNFTRPQMGLTKQGSGVSETDGSVNGDKPTHPSECFPRPTTQQQNYFWWSAFNPNFLKEVHYQSHPHEGCFYPRHYSPTNWVPHIPFQTHPLSHPPEHAFQDFQYFVVIDFEATCDKDKNPHPQEIIEFPSVLVNSRTGQLEDSFQIYVRPTYNQLLSDFCKELTGIQQSQVDKGVLLSDALLMHDKWLEEKGIKHTNFAVVTWSNWDCRVMLESECRFKRIRKPPYFNKWINLRVPFNEVFGGVRCNLKEAVELAGLTWEGRAHCGLDDAKNTARLLAHLMHHGFKFSITNSLLWQAPEYHPSAIHQAATPDHGLAYHPHKFKLPFLTVIPVQTGQQPEPMKEQYMYCHCGVISIKRMVKKPGPKHGSFFFGCGNWTAHRGALCPFFEWAVTDSAETA